MNRRTLLAALAAAALPAIPRTAHADEGIAVIANAPLRGVDADVVRRIWTGRTIELDGQPVRPVNLPPGHPLRRRFAISLLQQTDEEYVAYWTVRRYIGKGAPPREFATAAEVIEHVRRTPGALGYVDVADLRPGMVVVLRR